jgi:peptidyl-tRNA hydrolase
MAQAGIGAGLIAAAGAAAAGYYYYGAHDAPKHRKQASKWADNMKKEVVKEAKTLQKLDKKAMAVIIDRAAMAYEGTRNVKPEEVLRAAAELKANWKAIEAELAAAGSRAKSAATKSGSAVKHAAKTATASSRRAMKKVSPKKTAKKVAPKKAPAKAKSKKKAKK